MRILILEDEAIPALALRLDLEEMGHTVVPVARGDAAIAALTDGGFDLALLDVRVAGDLSGIDVAERLAGSFTGHVCFMSGYDDVAERTNHLDVFAVLRKPVERAALAAIVRAITATPPSEGADR